MWPFQPSRRAESRISLPRPTSDPELREYDVWRGEMSDGAHAIALLGWLLGDGGRAGVVPAIEVMAAYQEMCLEKRWEPHPWQTVGAALRRRLGCKRSQTRRISGRNTCVYVIPRPPSSLAVDDFWAREAAVTPACKAVPGAGQAMATTKQALAPAGRTTRRAA